uniref:Uncharacterized protein n=1 Tax=Strigops habroptila TaxID=2489341 RepID=A0A672UBY8_STRHB
MLLKGEHPRVGGRSPDQPSPTGPPPNLTLRPTQLLPLHRLLLLLPGGMCQVRAGLHLQGAPLSQVQLLQMMTPSYTSGGAKEE